MSTATRQHSANQEGGDHSLYLTEAGYAKLKKGLERIKRSLPGLIAETAQAAADGDRSDNAAYQSSKAALRRANWQVLEIEDELKRASIITAGLDPRGGIKLGSIVTLAVNGTERTFEIVGPKETDPATERISQESPLGAALIGKKRRRHRSVNPPRNCFVPRHHGAIAPRRCIFFRNMISCKVGRLYRFEKELGYGNSSPWVSDK